MTELHELSANDVTSKIAAREISSVELVGALLRRIEALEPKIRAWATLDREGALAAARERDQNLPHADQPPRLCGLPLGIKDIFYTAGLRTSANSPLLSEFIPTEDAGAVARLRHDGAIIMGKTVTTQFADGDPSETCNPWNEARTPGGSSSGSAAAVAARMIPGALGTQTGGSVLRPAAYCGIVGLKPTFGRISRRNVIPYAWSLDTMGVLTREVRDAALLLRALAGYDPLDDGSENQPIDHYRAGAEAPRAPQLGLVREYVDRSQPDVREHILSVGERLEKAGADVREVKFPVDLDLALASHFAIQNVEGTEVHARMHADSPDSYLPRLRAGVEVGRLIPGVAYLRAQRWRRKIRIAVDELLTDLDALLLPTASGVAPDPSTTGDVSFQSVFTMLGLPAITLPSGLNADRMPFGTQLVGHAWQEARLMSSARWCEQVFGALPSPC